MTADEFVRGEAATLPRSDPSICVRELDADWNITHVNDTHCALFCCSPEDLIGRKAWSLMVDPLAEAEQRHFLMSLLEEQPAPETFYCTERASNGAALPVRVDWAYRRNSAGDVVGFIWWLEKLAGGAEQQAIPGGQPYRELLDMMHDGVGLVHRNGSFIYVNERLCEILGASQPALIGRSIFLLGDKPGKQVLAAARAAARAAGRPGEINRCEMTHRHPNGTRMCLSVSGHGISPQSGIPIAGLIVVSDVTDRWRAETIRRRQAQIFDEIHDAVLVVDTERTIVDCNASAEQLFGYTKQALVGRPVSSLHAATAPPEQGAVIAAALRESGRWSGEIEIRRQDGSDGISEVTIGPIRGEGGQTIGYISVNRDVTERKATERALCESEERYRQLVEMQTDSVIVQDETGKILFANSAAAKLYRADSAESLTRENWRGLLAPEIQEIAVKRAAEVLKTGLAPTAVETTRRRLDGTLVDVEASSRRVIWGGRMAVMGIARDITERKRAESALLESEAKFRNLVSVSIQGYAIIGTDWRLLFCNDAIARIFGYSGVMQMGEAGAAKSLLADEHVERVTKASEAVLNGLGSRTLEFEGRRRDGSSIWLNAAIGLVDWEGEHAIQAAVVDITQRKEAEIALLTSEAKVRLVTDALPGFVNYIDPDYCYQFNNKAYEAWFGIPREQLRGTHISEVIGEVEYCRIRPWLDSGLAGRTTKFEVRTGADGRRYLRGTFIPDVDPSGAVRGVVSYITDVSEQKNAENALRLQAALLENMAEGVGLITPADRRIVYANPKLERMLDYEPGGLMGCAIDVLVTQGQHSQLDPAFKALEASGGWVGDMECATKSGESLWCRGNFTTFDHPDHGVVWIGVFADISEEKKVHRALQEAKEEAVRANAAKSRFLASASHDLRQPLQASNLFLAALADARTADERDEITSDLGTALITMGSLLNALLDVSKLEAKVVHPEITDFNLRGMLTQLAAEFGAQARAKGIEMRLVGSSTVVRTDPSLLSRVLGNFLANAVQHTERGKILFGCRRIGASVRIAVLDTGGGIPEEGLELIFEEFYQHGKRRPDRNTGLGLGLAIAQRTARLLEHPLHVTSQVGRGSMFAVDVPLGSVAREAEEARRWSQMVTGDIAGATIVVLEDDAIVRKATERLLRGWGAVVIAREGSGEAIDELGRAAAYPDILIADYQLVDETGIEAVAKIREVCGRDIPTIMVTGDPTPERLAEIAGSGATTMSKPVSPAELRLLVRKILRAT